MWQTVIPNDESGDGATVKVLKMDQLLYTPSEYSSKNGSHTSLS